MKTIYSTMIVVMAIAMMAMTTAAYDAPSMWMEQNDDNTISVMVSTSDESNGASAHIYFDPAAIDVTNVNFEGSPWQPMEQPGWSHQDDHVILVATEFSGVAAGEYRFATLDVTCLSDGASTISITQAEPAGVTVYNLEYVCGDTPTPDGAVVSIGTGTDTVTLPITVSGAVNAGAVDVTLNYDPDVVRVIGTVEGEMDCTYTNDQENGVLRVGAIQGDNPGLDSFTVLNVNFEPTGVSGSCSLDLTVTTLKDATPAGDTITHTVSAGRYSYAAFVNGDVNDDSIVDIVDANYLAKYIIGIVGYETINVEAADVNGDGMIDMADPMYLTKHVMGTPGFETLM